MTVIVKVAHVRLCHSRMLFARAYPRETQEMVFDAHDRAFALFKGTCAPRHLRQHEDRGRHGLQRQGSSLNRRFMLMCSHYLYDPVACNAGLGLGEGPG